MTPLIRCEIASVFPFIAKFETTFIYLSFWSWCSINGLVILIRDEFRPNCKNCHIHLFAKNLLEIPLRSDSEEEEGHSVISDPAEVVDLINSLEEIEGSEDEGESFVDIKLEEEQEEPDVLLTGQGDAEEEQTSAKGVETEDKNEEQCEVEGEQSVINVSCTEGSEEEKTVSYLSDV